MEKTITSKAYRQFIEMLCIERVNRGLSQVELAKVLKKPQQFVSRYENLERRLDVLEFTVIANALGIDPAKAIDELAQAIKD